MTSSNARKMLEWAFTQKERVLFLPDQHLGRNTAYDLGVRLEQMAVWDPESERLEFDGDIEQVKIILWKGHCSVHALFTVKNIEQVRKNHPDAKIIVHPECSREVVALADYAGSTTYIIETIKNSNSGTKWAVGTEMNLVNRLAKQCTDKEVFSLNLYMCTCLTMNRIDLPHLLWSLEALEKGEVVNEIRVEKPVAEQAKKALDRMLERA